MIAAIVFCEGVLAEAGLVWRRWLWGIRIVVVQSCCYHMSVVRGQFVVDRGLLG